MKEFWSNKYVGKRWTYPVKGGDKYNMCLPFVLQVLRDEKGFNVTTDEKDKIYDAGPEWYKKSEGELIEKARRYGKMIRKVEDLREWDVVFIKVDGNIRHCGVMIDKFKFIHQRKSYPAAVDRITSPDYRDNFYVGIRWLNG